MVTIATFNERTKAKHLRDRFQNSGITADVAGEGGLQRAASLADKQANVKVKVDEKDFERARKMLLEWEKTDPEVGAALRCPQCGSPDIEYPQLTRKFLTPALAGILFALKLFPKEYYCQSCHNTWPPEEGS